MDDISKIVMLKPEQWAKIGRFVVKWIREDFAKGIFQNGKSSLKYISNTYKRYKSNAMKKMRKDVYKQTDIGSGISDKFKMKVGTKKAFTNYGKSTGDRLQAYRALPIESTTTSFVDMTLTGHLKKGLKVQSSDESSVTLAYDSADTDKIIGNERLGRVVTGLNDENVKKARQMLIEELNKNIDLQKLPDLNINIKL